MGGEESNDFPEFYTPDSDGNFPWDHPCWNNDWEVELKQDGYKTMHDWNLLGRVIKKGEKGVYLRCERSTVFKIDQTFLDRRLAHSFCTTRKPPKKNEEDAVLLGKDRFLLNLLKNGGGYIKTKSQTWTEGVILKKGDNTIFILFRKNGTDIKFFNKENGSFVEKNNCFSFIKGKCIRLNYRDNEQVFKKASTAFKLFDKKCEIETIIKLINPTIVTQTRRGE